jgi:streptomycin 6-kinase
MISREWLRVVPDALDALTRRWSLASVSGRIDSDGCCSWIAFVTRADDTPAVLKFGMPHMEGRDEIAGLRFWNGDPTVRLLEADDEWNAMLLERCEPGTSLRLLPERDQDVIVAGMLHRLWRHAPAPTDLRPLSEMIDSWSEETLKREAEWSDAFLVREGLRSFDDLIRSTMTHVPLATDLHAGNVLRAQREPWLVIDPKPFVGDPTFDGTQHLLNCQASLHDDPQGTVARFADLLDVDAHRLGRWTFARLAAEPRDDWSDAELPALAKKLWTYCAP